MEKIEEGGIGAQRGRGLDWGINIPFSWAWTRPSERRCLSSWRPSQAYPKGPLSAKDIWPDSETLIPPSILLTFLAYYGLSRILSPSLSIHDIAY